MKLALVSSMVADDSLEPSGDLVAACARLHLPRTQFGEPTGQLALGQVESAERLNYGPIDLPLTSGARAAQPRQPADQRRSETIHHGARRRGVVDQVQEMFLLPRKIGHVGTVEDERSRWIAVDRGRREADHAGRICPMGEAFDPAAFPNRLNLGCGFDHREGYLNVDIHEFHHPDLLADVTKLNMLPASAYEAIVAQDVLEHLPRTTTVTVLREWSRLLVDGGVLHLRVPSVIDLVELMKAPEHQPVEQQERFIQCLFGTQAYSEDTHYTTFTEPLLRNYLGQADLEVTTWGLRDGWLFEVDAIKVGRPPADPPARSSIGNLARRLALRRRV
jgi:predicted SAM-dependent methyltransferase